MWIVIWLLLGSFPVLSMAQGFLVGYRQITFTDPSRSNRSIPTDVYYPATSSGTNAPIASGSFPVLVLGMGLSWM
jgi:predicted dienelactone hydrolase